jgi:hypothetical protein
MIHSKRIVSSAIRSLFWYTPLRRLLFYRYAYNFTPEQLAFLVQCLNETRDVSRDVFQVGCARLVAPAGTPPVFLTGISSLLASPRTTTALIRFGGFTAEDVAFEITQRGKKRSDFTAFRSNSLKWFEYTLKQNGCRRTFCVRGDVQNFEFAGPFPSACLMSICTARRSPL